MIISYSMRRNGNKVAVSVNISIESYKFLQSKIDDKTFSSLSHGVEFAIARLMNAGTNEKE